MQLKEKETQSLLSKIAISATFTAEPIAESLAFWMQELNLPASIEFAPYSQVFQQLLEPSSLQLQNHKGINVILLRIEDWEREEERAGVGKPLKEITKNQIQKTIDDLAGVLKAAAEQSATPYLICFCPPSTAAATDTNRHNFYQQMQEFLHSELAGIPNFYIITPGEIAEVYPVNNYYDPYGDELGHIPYKPIYFAALGTTIARKIRAILTPAYKVIVLDCDGTIWKGVVGEDGATGIEIDAPRIALQKFMVRQSQAGMLLCLCSKNIEADVIEVFEKRSEMPLKREHLVAWRINWQAKSENLIELAKELNLGLDSFIFIDDNPVECAAMQANCPEVLTLLLPEAGEIEKFLAHVWAFDRLKVTQEDKKRTELYKQNIQREQLRATSLTLDKFLESLDLEIIISPTTNAQINRVSQLTLRTNQFNFTSRRRSESEVQQLLNTGYECLVCEVKDRFGDYGLVGLMIFNTDRDFLNVDTFLLSCRVLGRGVEHKMLAKLGEIAQQRGLSGMEVFFSPTAKNQPALDFLLSVGKEFQENTETGLLFHFPAEYAANLTYKPASNKGEEILEQPQEEAKQQTLNSRQKIEKSTQFNRIVGQLWNAEEILKIIETQKRQQQWEAKIAYGEPSTMTEKKLAQIWQQLLAVEKVGIKNNFFGLGGNSLQVTQLKWRVQESFNQVLPLETFFENPILENLAKIIERGESQEENSIEQQIFSEIFNTVEQLSEEEARNLLEQHLAGFAQEDSENIKEEDKAYYCCANIERIPLQNKTELVYSKTSKNRQIMSAETVAMLVECRQFKTLHNHAREIRRQGKINQRIDDIKKELAELAEKGFLISKKQVIESYQNVAETSEKPQEISTLGMFTYHRPGALKRGLTSYIENCKKHNRKPEFAVMDDSQKEEIKQQNRQILRELKQQYGASILYAGITEKQNFAKALIETGNLPAEVVNFALLSGALGANRNALALHTAGENMMSVDDDTLCQIAVSPTQKTGLAFTSECDPGDLQTFSDRQAAINWVEYAEKDLLEIHEILLGKSLKNIFSQLGENSQIDFQQADANFINRLKSTPGKVLVTRTGIVGDCAWRTPFGYLGKPYGYLLLDGIAHERLVESETYYRAACSSREIMRMVSCPTISDDTVSLGAFWGLDNRELLPPFMPVMVGGEDFLFGTLLWICCQDGYFGHLPWGCVHEPVENRRFSPGEIFRSASGFDTSKLVMACIKSMNFSPNQTTPKERMQALGQHLMQLGSLLQPEFEKIARSSVLRDNEQFIYFAEKRLKNYGESPNFWANDVKKYINLLCESMTQEDYIIPLDLVGERNIDEARNFGKELVFKFGQLLYWWPEIFETAKQLRQNNQRLAVETF